MTVMECKDESIGLSSASAARTGKNREFEIGEQSGDFPQDVRKRCQDSKKSARRKKHSKSLEKQMRVDKEENSESVDQDEVAQDLRDNFPIIKEQFDVLSKVGEGTFSKVYLARIKSYPKEIVAVKHIVPTSSPTRVKNELACLQRLGDKNNIIGVKTTLRNNDHTAFLLPYFKHEKFQTYFRRLTVGDIKNYMRNLFTALKHVHQYNIIHRDVKPSNFLHSRKTNRYLLVDFGLAMQVPGTTGILSSTDDIAACSKTKQNDSSKRAASSKNAQYEFTRGATKGAITRGEKSKAAKQKLASKSKSDILCKHGNQPGHPAKAVCSFCCGRSGQVAPRAGTPGFRSPEVLMKLPDQTTAVDIWSAGVILLSFLSGRYPFFKAKDDLTSLAQIVTVFGTKEATLAGDILGKDLLCSHSVPACDLKSLCEKLRQKTCRYHEPKRNKRKYSLRDGSSKRLKTDSSGVETEGNRNELDSDDNSTSTGDVFQQPAMSTDNQSLAERVKDSNREKKRNVSKIRCNSDVSLAPIANNDTETRRGESSSCSEYTMTKAAQRIPDRLMSERASNSSNFDCYCVPNEAYDLLSQCLQLNPSQRITANDALRHCFLAT